MKKNLIKLQIGVIGAVLLYMYWPVFCWMIEQWENNPNYTHGYIVPLACGYLIFKKREILKKIPAKASMAGIRLFGVGMLLYLLGNRIEFVQISLFSFLVVVFGLVLFYQGRERFREFIFPLGYFIFAIPMPEYLESFTIPLKSMASKVSTDIMQMFGFNVIREGNIIFLPNYTLEVATACS